MTKGCPLFFCDISHFSILAFDLFFILAFDLFSILAFDLFSILAFLAVN